MGHAHTDCLTCIQPLLRQSEAYRTVSQDTYETKIISLRDTKLSGNLLADANYGNWPNKWQQGKPSNYNVSLDNVNKKNLHSVFVSNQRQAQILAFLLTNLLLQ